MAAELSPVTRVDTDTSGELLLQDKNVKTKGRINSEGRVNLSIQDKNCVLTTLLQDCLRRNNDKVKHDELAPQLPKWLADEENPPPPMNIVIQIVGSRGDVQPFVALGKNLKEQYGHRIRLATHATFQGFVEENGLEFFSIGGNPAALMEYMVKNPGLIPGRDSLKHGDVGKRKQEIAEIVEGCWRSCIEAGDGMDNDTEYTEEHAEKWKPFVANAIIANPPGFAHCHCAERLGIPFHLMFTMPWSPTTSFPHPLANIQSTDTDPRVANFVSYSLVQILTWQGLGPVINEFRQDTLGLEPVSIMWMPKMIAEAKIPFTYCWSPALIPKPPDWGDNLHVAGFYFLQLASSFTPDPELVDFLDAGPPPVYIGFGSIVVADPDAMTNLIFEATKKAGVRALISKGWGGLGSDSIKVPKHVYMLGNVPHDWLFKYVSAVCHHGGAGTTAAGIAAGRPTIVVPFFGDQPFWGSMVHRAGAGPEPIPHKQLRADKLADAIRYCLKEETQAAAKRMGQQISQENGPQVGAQHFHSALPMESLRCACAPDTVAVWRVKRRNIRLGALACAVLMDRGLIKAEDLKLNRTAEYDMSDQPWDPVTGAATALIGNLSNFMVGTASLPADLVKAIKKTKRTNTNTDIESIASRQSTSSELSRSQLKVSQEQSFNYVHNASHVLSNDWVHLLKIPRETILGLAKGFHNAPKLYHDRTVRTPDKVTDLASGIKVAGKELGFGVYDAVTGLVTQPYHGAKEEGPLGFLKGAGKGIGGLLLKPEAAILGAIGYTMDGMYKHHRKCGRLHHEHHHGKKLTVEEQVAASWLLQGYAAFGTATKEQKDSIVQRWYEVDQTEKIAKAEKLAHRPSARIKTWGSSHRAGLFHRRTGSSGSKEDTASLKSKGDDASLTNKDESTSIRSAETASLASMDRPETKDSADAVSHGNGVASLAEKELESEQLDEGHLLQAPYGASQEVPTTAS